MIKTILVTGFDPFGKDIKNASWEAVKKLPLVIDKCRIRKRMVPTTFKGAPKQIRAYARLIHADLVIMVGQAGGRAKVTPELQAKNYWDAHIPDNRGFRPVDSPIIRGGPSLFMTELPVKELIEDLSENGEPVALSEDAGSYVCNSTYYQVGVALRKKGIPCLFVHVPSMPEQSKDPSIVMESSKAAAILEKIIAWLTKECK